MKSIFGRLILGVIVFGGLVGCRPDTTPVAGSGAENPVATNAPAVGAPAKNEYEFLIGKWERPDGGYVLEIRNTDAAGRLEAGYFNPAPIKVSQARAYREGGHTKVFIELRDVNYPGSTYTLTYDAKDDQLFGEYFQAAMQQTYPVAFARLK